MNEILQPEEVTQQKISRAHTKATELMIFPLCSVTAFLLNFSTIIHFEGQLTLCI